MRLYIGTQATCNVLDHFYVLRCFKCQAFGHHSSNCTKSAKCGYCGEGHETRSCQVKCDLQKKCCVNFKQSGLTDINHEASCITCPAFLENHAKAKRMIPFYQGNQ